MLKSRLLLMVVATTLGGCTGLPGLGKAQGDMSSGGVASAPAEKVTLKGSVSVPSALVANNASALVGNNANALVANNSSALVANNASALGAPAQGFRVQAVAEVPVEGLVVAAYDASGNKVSDAATTDKDGAFSLQVSSGSSALLVGARGEKIREMAIGFAGSDVKVSAGSTLAAYKILDSKQLSKATKSGVESLTKAFDAAIKDSDLGALQGDEKALKEKVDALVESSDAIKSAAAGVSGSSSDSSSGGGTSAGGGSSGGSSGGGSSSGGGTSPGKTSGKIALGDWQAAVTGSGKTWPTMLMASSAGIKSFSVLKDLQAGDKLHFWMEAGDGQVAYLKFFGSGSDEVGRVVFSRVQTSGLEACGESNTKSCYSLSVPDHAFVITLDKAVAKLEFGGDPASTFTVLLTQIDINPPQ